MLTESKEVSQPWGLRQAEHLFWSVTTHRFVSFYAQRYWDVGLIWIADLLTKAQPKKYTQIPMAVLAKVPLICIQVLTIIYLVSCAQDTY